MTSGVFGHADVVHLPEDVYRLVVLGDPHGDVGGVTAILDREGTPGTRFACAGDVVGYADGPRSSELCALLAARRIPTVQGNHEDWIEPPGRLAIVESRAANRVLTPAALDWIQTLPEVIHFVREPSGEPLAVLIHSIREPGWDWIDTENVAFFLDALDWPSLVVTGHSHRPKFIEVERSGSARRHSFNYLEGECDVHPLPEAASLVVDAGSVGRPEATECIGTKQAHDGARFGTYAVLDFKSRTASLRRIEKSRNT